MKVSVFIATSLDGFIARENGDVDWLTVPDLDENGEDYGFQEFMDSIDVLVMGRNTFEMVVSFGEWVYGDKTVIVLSSRPIQIPSNFRPTIEVHDSSPIELVQKLTTRGAKHLYIDGGKTIQGFLNAGLIQQLIITRIPIILGKGIPLFGPVSRDIKLKLIKTTTFPNGLVQINYEVLS